MKIRYKFLNMLFGNGLVQLSRILVVTFLARVLTPYVYASYSQINLVQQTLLPFFTLSIPITLSYYLPRIESQDRQKTIVLQSILLLFGMGFIACIALFIFSPQIARLYNNETLKGLFQVSCITLLFEIASSFYTNYLLGLNRSKKLSKVMPICSFLRIALVVAAVFLFEKELLYIVYALLFFSIVKFAYMLNECLAYFHNAKFSFDFPLLKEQVFYSIPICAASLVSILGTLLDRNMVAYFFTPEKYAIFSNGAIEIPVIGILTSSLMAVVLPELSKLYKEDNSNNVALLKLWHNVFIHSSAIVIPLMVGMFIFTEGFVLILFSEKYLQSSSVFQVYLFMLPINAIQFGSLLMIAKKQKAILYNSIVYLFVNFILNILLISLLGLIGPAVATVIALYFLAWLQSWQISRAFHISIKNLFPWGKYRQIIFIAFTCGVPFYTINAFFLSKYKILAFLIGFPLYFFFNIILFIKIGVMQAKVCTSLLQKINPLQKRKKETLSVLLDAP